METTTRTAPSTREALTLLRQSHGLHRRQAAAVLAAGLGGPATADARARRYDLSRLHALVDWTELADDEIWAACPYGVFIARIADHRGFHIAAPRPDQTEAVRGPWYVPLLAHLWIQTHADDAHRFPFVATVGDFVVFGGEITGQSYLEDLPRTTNMFGHRTMWELAEPGPWYDAFKQRRLTFGPGYPWRIWGAPVSVKQPSTDVEDFIAGVGRAGRPRGRRRSPDRLASLPPSAPPPPGPTA